MSPKGLDYESLNENVKKVAYAVRGELYLRASELQKEGKKVYTVFCWDVIFNFVEILRFMFVGKWIGILMSHCFSLGFQSL